MNAWSNYLLHALTLPRGILKIISYRLLTLSHSQGEGKDMTSNGRDPLIGKHHTAELR